MKRRPRFCNNACRKCAAWVRFRSAVVRLRRCGSKAIRPCCITLDSAWKTLDRRWPMPIPTLPKDKIADESRSWWISPTDRLMTAKEYEPLIVTYRKNSPVRLQDVASVTDSVEDIRATGITDGKPSIMLIVYRQPNANIIDTVDRVKALVPMLQAQIPAGMNLDVGMDRTQTIRASVHEVQNSMII